MNIRIIAVGKIKEKYLTQAIQEYTKRLSAYCRLEIIEVTFIIGGSIGISPGISNRSKWKISFSEMTFPHQLFRVMLLEQIYRSFKIIRGETYHK